MWSSANGKTDSLNLGQTVTLDLLLLLLLTLFFTLRVVKLQTYWTYENNTEMAIIDMQFTLYLCLL